MEERQVVDEDAVIVQVDVVTDSMKNGFGKSADSDATRWHFAIPT